MKLKMYLRGLGAGIIIAAIIMGLQKPAESSDISSSAQSEENTTLQDIASNIEESNEEKLQEAATMATSEAADSTNTDSAAAASDMDISDTASTADSSFSNASSENSAEIESSSSTTIPEDGEKYVVENTKESKSGTIVISSGDSSDGVSRKLYDAGFIDSEADFNDYLVKNGYDRKIRVGQKDIPSGADYAQIAKIITN